jgi:MSHA biogenesis protein MshP
MMLIRRQKGFSLIAAIFLVTVVALLLLVLSRSIAVQDRSSFLSVMSNRAYFSARAGLEWAAVSALGGSCGVQSLNIEGIAVITQCTATTGISEGGGTYNIYNLSVTASTGSKSTDTLVSRTLVGQVTDAPAP